MISGPNFSLTLHANVSLSVQWQQRCGACRVAFAVRVPCLQSRVSGMQLRQARLQICRWQGCVGRPKHGDFILTCLYSSLAEKPSSP